MAGVRAMVSAADATAAMAVGLETISCAAKMAMARVPFRYSIQKSSMDGEEVKAMPIADVGQTLVRATLIGAAMENLQRHRCLVLTAQAGEGTDFVNPPLFQAVTGSQNHHARKLNLLATIPD